MQSTTGWLSLHKSTVDQLQFQIEGADTATGTEGCDVLSETLHLCFISYAFVRLCVCMCWWVCACHARATEATAGRHRCTGSDDGSQDGRRYKLQTSAKCTGPPKAQEVQLAPGTPAADGTMWPVPLWYVYCCSFNISKRWICPRSESACGASTPGSHPASCLKTWILEMVWSKSKYTCFKLPCPLCSCWMAADFGGPDLHMPVKPTGGGAGSAGGAGGAGHNATVDCLGGATSPGTGGGGGLGESASAIS